ncbi:MAG: hypothetical protein UT55_C0001G0002 [Candidatus Peregrinibacteria bacterium GW2011_GWE2_39_6]|nr:MAG: hypothetical protein UT36_C0005G0026 [Candidatus Peregrinibacteria bacterium GW2011_GWF2_39_17]KKR26791.1 MAG: hypothetical protein UT55_C0001G0002 [Candidatus Peregrinibacteria bacterium GW2011_GWE2_39_6]HCW32861.1 hypothetical protein [Candidatus Peregrinibacteria bacterium]
MVNKSVRINVPRWTWRDFLGVFSLDLVGIIFLMIIANFLVRENGIFSKLSEAALTVILYFLQTLVLGGSLAVFTFFKYKNNLGDFGLVKIKVRTILLRVAQGFLFYYLVSSIFVQIILSYDLQIPGYGQQASHIPLFGDSIFGFLIGGLIIVILAPLVEEVFFRGYVYQFFKKYFNVFWGSIFASLLFSLFHFEFQVLIPIFILGLVLNWLFEKSGSLWTSIAFHMLNNAMAFMVEIALYYHWIQG